MRDLRLSLPWRLARRVRQFFRRRGLERAMDDEMRFHIECETAERIRNGMSPEEAAHSARRDFGSVDRHQELARDIRGLRAIDEVGRDMWIAVRVLRRNPAYTVAAAVTFALGVGCSSTIFSLVHGILLKPLPYAAPDQLVAVWERNAASGGKPNVTSVGMVEAWHREVNAFSHVVALVPAPMTLDGDPAERITGAQVSADFFRMLGVAPALGRDFDIATEAHDDARVVILSDEFWRSRFGGDSGIVGRTIPIDGRAVKVIGVMPRSFDPPRFGWMTHHPLWIPFAATEGNRTWGRFLHVVARLKPEASIDVARAQLAELDQRRVTEQPAAKSWASLAVPLAEQITGDVRAPIKVLFGAAGLLLLMAIANIANLAATFDRRRAHEVALQRALGATTGRLARQRFAEHSVLAAGGLLGGILIAHFATGTLAALMPATMPRTDNVRLTGTVLLFAALVACATTFTLVVQGTMRARNPIDGGMHPAASRVTRRFSGSRLITTEVAVGMVLTVIAMLMVRSLERLRAVDLGYDPSAVVAARISLPTSLYETDMQRAAFFESFGLQVRAIPGVTGASFVTTRPMACCAPATSVIDPAAPPPSGHGPTADIRYVDAEYFRTMRIPVIAGRNLERMHTRDGDVLAVVSQSMAAALWGNADPIEREIAMSLNGSTTARVIGVVGNVRLNEPRGATRPTVYVATARFPSTERDIVVRGSGHPTVLLRALRSVLGTIDARIPLASPASLEEAFAATIAQDRLVAALLGGFAAISLILAALGVYGVLAGDVARRRKEIGIRLALGASSAGMIRLVLARTLRPTAIGVIIGIVTGLVVAKSMSTLVFGVSPFDPMSFAVVAVTLVAVAAGATAIPAFRASRVPPAEIIRAE